VLAVAATAAVAALGAFVAPGAAGKGHGNSRPHASLRVSDRTATVGQKIVLDSSRSRDRDGRIAYHLWDLDGDGVYETSTHRRARVRHAFDHTGKVRVGVAVFDGDGGYAVRRATVRVAARETHRAEPAAKHARRARVRTATKKNEKGETKARRHAKAKAKAKTSSGDGSPTLHAAATTTDSVTISDFKFAPKEITVSVGTTVTWTNQGPTAHTATADDGTFDTGNLVKGASNSYKFTTAGTYKYHCTPHPFMKGTVTVTGSGGSSAPDSSSNNSSSNNSSSSNSGKKSNLPHTGLEIASFVLAGLALLGTGAALRRRLAGS
jgi:LPXTG-motif cell wall-anchored protein